MVNKGRLYIRTEAWMRRRGWLVLFLLSVLPNPVFDLAGIAAGAASLSHLGLFGRDMGGYFHQVHGNRLRVRVQRGQHTELLQAEHSMSRAP